MDGGRIDIETEDLFADPQKMDARSVPSDLSSAIRKCSGRVAHSGDVGSSDGFGRENAQQACPRAKCDVKRNGGKTPGTAVFAYKLL